MKVTSADNRRLPEIAPVDGVEAAGVVAKRYTARITKCLVSLVFWCSTELARAMLRAIGGSPAAVATVLYYHQILPHERQRFARQLAHLCRWVKPIPADLNQALPQGLRCAAVTFDDGWSSFADIALPELASRNIPVTLFAIAGRLGQRLEPEVDEPLVSAVQLAQLAADGVTVGSHTLTHCRLTEVDETTAFHELHQSRRLLSELLNGDVTMFAFPFGSFSERLLTLCREAGYERVFTGLPYLAYSQIGEFNTGRVRVDPADWPIEFHLKLMGAYRWLPMAFAVKRWLRFGIRRAAERAVAAML